MLIFTSVEFSILCFYEVLPLEVLVFCSSRYYPFEEDNHRLVREIGNVTSGVEITFQFAVKPDRVESK